MSGGHYGYKHCQVDYLADEIEGDYNNGGIVETDGEYPSNRKTQVDLFDGVPSELREKCLERINKLVKDLRDVSKKAKELDYIMSGDSWWREDFYDD